MKDTQGKRPDNSAEEMCCKKMITDISSTES